MDPPSVFPRRTYDDAPAAIAFLERAFGAEQHVLQARDAWQFGTYQPFAPKT
jgi:uncharacterized glyoxalase superfamily protein PhnB